jgi:hypothetical protein
MIAAALPFIPTAVIDRYALPLRALLLVAAVSFAWMAAVRAATGRWPRPAPPGTGLPPRG